LVNPCSVLIVSDEPDFARTLIASWQAERHLPALTLISTELWTREKSPGQDLEYDLVIFGPARAPLTSTLLSVPGPDIAVAICVCRDGNAVAELRASYPRLLVIPQQDAWTQTVILVAGEALRRVEALRRAERAERALARSNRQATLGRYMLEMRHSFNDALTSVLGNADLLLLEPGQFSASAREQMKTLHSMTLRLNEIMQRFSSLASEMRLAEKESQSETTRHSPALVPRA
jgi:signal transduction histidine kinase